MWCLGSRTYAFHMQNLNMAHLRFFEEIFLQVQFLSHDTRFYSNHFLVFRSGLVFFYALSNFLHGEETIQYDRMIKWRYQ